MKKSLFLSLILFTISVNAQDVIVKKDGSTILSKVFEIGSSEIKYKKHSHLDGPIYTIVKSDIQAINYENGEKEVFDVSIQKSNNATKQIDNTPIKAQPADDNEEQKAKYSELPRLNLKQSKKESKVFFPIMAFTDSSVISTKELTIIIDPTAAEYYDGGWKVKIGYAIQIVNKSEMPIYIDRARCFRRYNDLETKNYFDNKQYSVTNGNGTGLGVSIGIGPIGIGTGGASSSSDTETYGIERILVIGPQSKANLLDYKYIRLSETKAKFKTVSDIEYWGFNLSSKDRVNQGGVKEYSESDTPYSNKYFMTYSTDPNFENSYTLNFELYAKYLVGGEIQSWKWSMLSPEARIVNEIQKTVPDFWTNSMSIIGMNGYYN